MGRIERGALGDRSERTDHEVFDLVAVEDDEDVLGRELRATHLRRALAANWVTLRRWRASAAACSDVDRRAWRAARTWSWSSRGASRKRSSSPAPARIRWMVGMLGSRLPLSIRAISDWVTRGRCARSRWSRPACWQERRSRAIAVVGAGRVMTRMIGDQQATLAGKAPARLLHRPQSRRVRQHGGPC